MLKKVKHFPRGGVSVQFFCVCGGGAVYFCKVFPPRGQGFDHVKRSGYTCDFLLALANRHPQSCSMTEVKGGCTCSQVSPISAAYTCKKFNSMNILQHCPSNFCCRIYPWPHTCNILVSQSLQHQKEVCCQ